MDIHLDLTEEEEQFIREMTIDSDIDLGEYVKELLLEELVNMAEFEEQIFQNIALAESEEEIIEAVKEQIRKVNPYVPEEEIDQLVQEFIESEENDFSFDDEDNEDDQGGKIIPFKK